MGSHSVTCHQTHVNAPCLNPGHVGRYSIYLPWTNGKLSWPKWLATCRDGLPAQRQSDIQVLTRPGAKQLCRSDTKRYRYAMPPTHNFTIPSNMQSYKTKTHDCDRPAGTFDESGVSKRSITELTKKAVRMPARVHCLDHATNHKLL